MTIDLTVVKNALEELTDIELQALATATDEAPQIAPGLIAWIDGACHWEMNRRTGRDYGLQPPEAATDPSEDAASINAVDAMRESFASSGFAPAALKFFDALLKLLSGGPQALTPLRAYRKQQARPQRCVICAGNQLLPATRGAESGDSHS
jgi:hypothetical protein